MIWGCEKQLRCMLTSMELRSVTPLISDDALRIYTVNI